MKKTLLLIALVSACFVSGCATFEGLGQDMKKAGKWVENKADNSDE